MNPLAVPASGHESAAPDLSAVVVHLLKGVLYEDTDGPLWSDLLRLQARVRDYVSVMYLELVVDEAEGYAFLRAAPDTEQDAGDKRPRLVARRQLSFRVSLLLVLLRKRLAEFDASGADTRLVLRRSDIIDLLRVFARDSSNEARFVDQVDAHIKRVMDLGFVRALKVHPGDEPSFEVRRILKAYVDAQWLADFDQRLAAYRDKFDGEQADA